jgi:hypothetical protein
MSFGLVPKPSSFLTFNSNGTNAAMHPQAAYQPNPPPTTPSFPFDPSSSTLSSTQNIIFGVLATTFAFVTVVQGYKQLRRLRESRNLNTDLENPPRREENATSPQDSQTDSLHEEYEMDDSR